MPFNCLVLVLNDEDATSMQKLTVKCRMCLVCLVYVLNALEEVKYMHCMLK